MSDRRNAERLWQRIARAVAIGRTTTASNEGGNTARVQVSLNEMETLDGQGLLQHFGFASGLPVGTDTVHLFITGNRSNGLIIGTNHPPSRPRTLAPGQVAIYDQAGSMILLDNGGNIVLIPRAGGHVRVQADLQVTGNVVWTCDTAPTDAEGHVHGGVMPGAGDTGAPIAGS